MYFYFLSLSLDETQRKKFTVPCNDVILITKSTASVYIHLLYWLKRMCCCRRARTLRLLLLFTRSASERLLAIFTLNYLYYVIVCKWVSIEWISFFLYCCQLSLILFRDIILLSHGVTLSIFRQRWVFIFQWQSEKAQETQWIFTMIWNFHQSNLRVCEFVLLSLPHNRTVLSKQQIVLIFRFRLSKCTHTHNHEYPINFVRQSTEW